MDQTCSTISATIQQHIEQKIFGFLLPSCEKGDIIIPRRTESSAPRFSGFFQKTSGAPEGFENGTPVALGGTTKIN
jgi:hypothetical protein